MPEKKHFARPHSDRNSALFMTKAHLSEVKPWSTIHVNPLSTHCVKRSARSA